MLAAVVESAPAGGAEAIQIAIGGIASSVWFAVVALVGARHRAGTSSFLTRAGDFASARTGMPGWVALPAIIATGALGIAAVGFVWDVALHINSGRDAGPFANPSHYMLIAGTTLFVTAGFLAMVMPLGRSAGRSAVRITEDWWAPAGGVSIFACGIMALSGFVLDDFWHRLFGQDVTLWGPTHLMMITGGLLVLFSSWALIHEGQTANRAAGLRGPKPGWALAFKLLVAGGALAGLTIAYQQEFGYGMPQFRLLFEPVLIATSAGLCLVGARLSIGRGGAVGAMLTAVALLALLAGVVGPVFGELTLAFPLYAVEAVLVELAATALLARRGPRTFALASGVLIGTVGVLGEWSWVKLWHPIEWPAQIIPEALLLSVPVAVAGALVGEFIAGTFTPGEARATRRRASLAPALGLVVTATILGGLLYTTAPKDVLVRFQLNEVAAGAERTANATIRFDPATAVKDPDWLVAFAWQGDSDAITQRLRQSAPGVWQTTKPIPLHGTWKSLVRFHRGPEMASAWIYAPADSAIPAPAMAAPRRFTRPLTSDRRLMQRERRADVPPWLFAFGSSIVALITAVAILCVGWALSRAARSAAGLPRGDAGSPIGASDLSAQRGAVVLA